MSVLSYGVDGKKLGRVYVGRRVSIYFKIENASSDRRELKVMIISKILRPHEMSDLC